MYLSLYIFTLLSNVFSIDKSVGVGVSEDLYLKNSLIREGMVAEFNAASASAKKQLS